MSVLFLCSGLENARNGVGDFCATVAASFAAQGRKAVVVSVRDTFSDLTEVPAGHRREEVRQTHAGPVRLFRLGTGHPDAWAAAGKFGNELSPAWVSLQFLCWGFHPRGLCRSLPADFARFADAVGSPFRTHVFLHELHCGRRPADPFREKVLGRLQLFANRRALGKIGSEVVHTSTSDYVREAAKNYALKALPLAIPSALPTAPAAGREAGRTRLLGLFESETKLGENPLVAALFGSVYPSWDPLPALASLRTAALRDGRAPAVCHVGRSGPGTEQLSRICAGAGVAFAPAGHLDDTSAAALLSACDLGLSPMPPDALGKSSALAALLAQGLPVIVTRPATGGFGDDPAFPLRHRIHFVDEANPAPFPPSFPPPGDAPWLAEFTRRLAADLRLSQP